MITVAGISGNDADVARSLLESAAAMAVSTGARAATSGARRVGNLEAWSFQRVEDVESVLALLEGYRRHENPAPDRIHAVDRLIAKLTAALGA